MFEAIRDILRGLRDLKGRTTPEFPDLAHKSRVPEIKNTLYALLSEKIVHIEVLRGLLRAYDRLEDLSCTFQHQSLLGEVEEKEWRRLQLRLEELQTLEERITKLLDLYIDEMDCKVTTKILKVLADNEKTISNELEGLLRTIREKMKQFYLGEGRR